ncbi:MAG: 2-C-methyl-D-erythritol 4-phosphate cytidylyltransferase, partial [Clostridia bacterium]|nr:2-C-methyl-D-erythritol 4-phosphate cytidylyltransferase [Clostridia bacterium]
GLEKNKAVTCAVALNDTVKVVDENGFVKTTPDRNSLVSVQTPQGVHIKEYREALSNKTDLSCFTDDMSIMEEAGYKVLTVLGSYKNFKITTKVDIFAAEGLIRRDETE